MPFYAITCRFNNSDRHALLYSDRKVLGLVEGATEDEAKLKAEALVKQLTAANWMSGHHAFPYYNFYFDCTPATPLTTLEDVLRANLDFFEQSYHWNHKLKELIHGDPAST